MLSPDQVASQGPGGFLNLLGGATDPYYAQADGSAYADAATACGAVPTAARRNRTVNVAGVEYWWLESDLSDAGLVVKSASPGSPGTAGGAPQWVSGAQKEGSLVFDNGITYRVRLNIANGTARPAAFPNGYLAIGPSGSDPTKADLGPDGRLKASQAPKAGRGVRFNTALSQFELDNQLDIGGPNEFSENTRVNTTTGQYVATPGWRTRECNFITPGVSYHSSIPLFYAFFSNTNSTTVLKKWTDGTGGTLDSTAPAGANQLCFSYETQYENAIYLVAFGGDAALAARVSALEALGGRMRGAWAASTAYLKNDMVVQAGGFYYANANFTSAATFDATKWTAISTGSGTPGTARDPLAIGDNASVTAAVKDASNTWVKGDLTAYGSQALQNAGAPAAVAGQNSTILVGTADVVTPDEFSGTDSTGSAWNYRYFRRNDGTSGWTRTPKG